MVRDPEGLMLRIAVVAVCSAAIACAPENPDLLRSGRWVDLTHDFSAETIYWPTAKPFALEVVSAQRTPAGYYYAANNFSAAEHGGTHLDAPVHFAEGKWTADQIPLDRLVGDAVVIDVQVRADSSADYRIDRDELDDWERSYGAIPAGAIVLFRTGWGRHWPDRAKYLGTTRTGPAAREGAALPRDRLDGGAPAGRAIGSRSRDRYAQHRLRPDQHLSHPSRPLRRQHSGVRERRQSRPAAGQGELRRGLADEDQGRERRAAPDRGPGSDRRAAEMVPAGRGRGYVYTVPFGACSSGG